MENIFINLPTDAIQRLKKGGVSVLEDLKKLNSDLQRPDGTKTLSHITYGKKKYNNKKSIDQLRGNISLRNLFKLFTMYFYSLSK